MKNIIDKIFKIGILITVIAFVVVYFFSSQSGRYQYTRDVQGGGEIVVFDTKTGAIHQMGEKCDGVVHIDLANNRATIDELEIQDKN